MVTSRCHRVTFLAGSLGSPSPDRHQLSDPLFCDNHFSSPILPVLGIYTAPFGIAGRKFEPLVVGQGLWLFLLLFAAQDATVSPFLLARLGLVALAERAAVD